MPAYKEDVSPGDAGVRARLAVHMADVAFILLTVVVFAALALIVKGVEKL